MNERFEYLDTHLKNEKVSSLDFAWINDHWDVHLFMMDGKLYHFEDISLAEIEASVIEAYLGYIPDGA